MTTLRCQALFLALLSTLVSCGRAPLAGSCGTCQPGQGCEVLSGLCLPIEPVDAGGCTSDSACGGATPRCQVDSGRCVGCVSDGDCTPGTCSAVSFTCEPLPDSCGSAGQALLLGAGPLTVTGSTAGANDDTRLSCSLPGSVGGDVVYALDVPRLSRLKAKIVPAAGSPLRPVLSLRGACDSDATERALGCSFSTGPAREATLVADALAPGRYFLWVDGDSGEGGAFTLSLGTEDPSMVDSCVAPGLLALGADPLLSSGDTGLLVDDAAGSCGGRGAPDAVYALVLTQPKRVRVEAVGSGSFQPLLYLRGACSDASASAQVSCALGAIGGTTVLEVPLLAAGTWHLFVDGPETGVTSGRYRLTVTALDASAPPPNDTCATALPLVVPPTELGRIITLGTTANAKNDALGCGGAGPDVAYALTLGQARQVSVKVSPSLGSPSRPVVSLRSPGKCASELVADTAACSAASGNGAPATLVVPRLGAGTWTLWVDGAAAGGGPFELTVELALPPPLPANDTCSAPAALTLSGAPVTVQGTTLGATDDVAACGVGLSPDVSYTLTSATRQSVSLDLRASGGSPLRPVLGLYAEAACGLTLASTAAHCAFGDPSFPDRATLVLPDVAPGAYTLWVDGLPGTQGGFSLRAVGGAFLTPPANDTCGVLNTPELLPGQSAPGDTRAAANDVSAAACGFDTGANGELAPDVAYVFTVTATRSVSLTVTPDAVDGQLFRPVISVRGPQSAGCSTTAPVKACAAAADYSKPVTVNLPSLAPGTYTLWVDGAGASSGRFGVLMQ